MMRKSYKTSLITLVMIVAAFIFCILPVAAESEIISQTEEVNSKGLFVLEVEGGTGSGTYVAGSMVKITVDTVPVGKAFEKWISDDESAVFSDAGAASTIFIMPAGNVKISAVFQESGYLATVFDGTGGGEYRAGETVAVHAEGVEGYRFSRWQSDSAEVVFADPEAADTSFVMPKGNVTVFPLYSQVIMYEVKVESGEGSRFYEEGQNVEIHAAPPENGMIFDHWEIVEGDEGLFDISLESTSFSMPPRGIKVKAIYRQLQFSVTVEGGTGGGVYIPGTTVAIEAGEPPAEQMFAEWNIQQGNVSIDDPKNPKASFVMPQEDVVISVKYQNVYYDSSVENGIYTITLYTDAGLAAGIKENLFEPGQRISAVKTADSNSQKFYIQKLENGKNVIMPVCSEFYLSEKAAENQYVVIQSPESDEKDQIFTFEKSRKGGYMIRSASGRYLSVQQTDKGNALYLAEGRAQNPALWKIQETKVRKDEKSAPIRGTIMEIKEGLYRFVPVMDSTRCLASESEKLTVDPQQDFLKQKFQVSRLSENGYAVASEYAGIRIAGSKEELYFSFVEPGRYCVFTGSGKALTYDVDSQSAVFAGFDKENAGPLVTWKLVEENRTAVDSALLGLRNGTVQLENQRGNGLAVVIRHDSQANGAVLEVEEPGMWQSGLYTPLVTSDNRICFYNNYTQKQLAVDINGQACVMDDSAGIYYWTIKDAQDDYFYLICPDGRQLAYVPEDHGSVVFAYPPGDTTSYKWRFIR